MRSRREAIQKKQRGSFITPETWMAARLIAARHDAGIKRVRATNKPLARPLASLKSRFALPTLFIAARFTVTLSPPGSLRPHASPPHRVIATAREAGGKQSRKTTRLVHHARNMDGRAAFSRSP